MIKNTTFLKSSITYIALEVFNKGLPFFLLPIYTRYLSMEGYGTLSIFIIFINVFVITIGTGTSGAINSNYFLLKGKMPQYIGNVILILVFMLLVNLSVMSVLSGYFISSLTFRWLVYALIIGFCKAVMLVFLSIMKMEGNYQTFGKVQFTITSLDAIATVVGLIFFMKGWEYRGAIMLIISIFSTIYIAVFLVNRKLVDLRISKEYIGDIIRFGIPLLPHQFSTWVRTGGDRYLISILMSVTSVGVYSANYQIGFGFAVVMLAFNQAYQPLLYKELSLNPSDEIKIKIVKRSYIIFLAVFFISVVLAVILPYVVPFVFGDEKYNSGVIVIPLLALASGFQGMYLILVLILLYFKKTILLSLSSSGVAIIHVTLSYFLIKYFGISGAGWASLVSYFLAFAFTWYLSDRIYPLPWNPIKLIYAK